MNSVGAGLVAALAGAVLFGIAAVVQAGAARRLPSPDDGWSAFLRASLRSLPLIAVVAAYLVGGVLHLVSIDLTPLYLAQAATSASLLVTAVAAGLVLHEHLQPVDWLAVLAVIGGIALLAVDAGEAGDDLPTDFRIALHVGVVALLALGYLATRLPRASSGWVLGLLGGIGYSGTALTARGLDAPYLSLATLDAALLFSAFGVVGFTLYTFALRRTRTTAATAPLVVAQTALPSLAGIAFLGDGAPPAVLLAAGLLLALAGTLWLTRLEESTLEHVTSAGEMSA